jgi:hypothetical protein
MKEIEGDIKSEQDNDNISLKGEREDEQATQHCRPHKLLYFMKLCAFVFLLPRIVIGSCNLHRVDLFRASSFVCCSPVDCVWLVNG